MKMILIFNKILIFIMILYMNLVQYYYAISNILLFFGLILSITTLYLLLVDKCSIKSILPNEILIQVLFILFTFVTGQFVAINIGALFSQFLTVFQILVLMICVLTVMYYENSLEYLNNIFILIPFVIAIVIMFGISNITDALLTRKILFVVNKRVRKRCALFYC